MPQAENPSPPATRVARNLQRAFAFTVAAHSARQRTNTRPLQPSNPTESTIPALSLSLLHLNPPPPLLPILQPPSLPFPPPKNHFSISSTRIGSSSALPSAAATMPEYRHMRSGSLNIPNGAPALNGASMAAPPRFDGPRSPPSEFRPTPTIPPVFLPGLGWPGRTRNVAHDSALRPCH